jgi:hypothetical protein
VCMCKSGGRLLWHSDSAVHRTRQRAKRWEWADEAGLMGVFLRDG